MGEITVILLLALIVLGPSKLPDLAAGLGKIIRDIRKATSDVKNEIILDDSFRKPFEELRDAVTLPPEELKRRDQVRKNIEEALKRAQEEADRAAAEAAALTPAAGEGVPALPEVPGEGVAALPETPVEGVGATSAAAPEATHVDAVVPPMAPPAGTVARTPPAAPVPASAAPMASHAPSAPHPAPAPPVATAPRVVPPVSSLDGDRANVTQALSEADLLASLPQPARRLTPPPLPGLSRPAGGRVAPARPTPAAPIRTANPDATQVLSEKDLLPPSGTAAAGTKPPPPGVPDPKKT